jgi:hypothetical protein
MLIFEAVAVLALGTLLVLGWVAGSIIVCTFLTLAVASVAAILLAAGAVGGALGGCCFALAVIWLPVLVRMPSAEPPVTIDSFMAGREAREKARAEEALAKADAGQPTGWFREFRAHY